MTKDRWGKPVQVDFTWACRDGNMVATDSCLSIRIGAVEARFYEDNLPALRHLVAVLARQMALQERGAHGHGRENPENVDWLREALAGLVEALPDDRPSSAVEAVASRVALGDGA